MSPAGPEEGGVFKRLDELELPFVRRFARMEGHRLLRRLMLLSTRAADGWILLLVVPVGLLVDPARALAATVVGVAAGLFLAVVVALTKRSLKRERPRLDLERPITAYDRHAFPSGHSAHALSAALFVAWAWPPLGALLLLGVLFVGASRVFFALHYPSDVLAGWLLGGGLAALWSWLSHRTGLMDRLLQLG